jgi:hypothetical protein
MVLVAIVTGLIYDGMKSLWIRYNGAKKMNAALKLFTENSRVNRYRDPKDKK